MKNMGKFDRIIRLSVAALIVALAFMGIITGWLLAVLLILAGIFVLTSLVRTCPLYMPLGIRTNRNESPQA